MLLDYLKYIMKNIAGRKLRTWLTMLGIFVGIAAVVALVSLSQGLQNAINAEFEKIGVNRVLIVPGGVNFGPFSSGLTTAKLTEDDLNVVRKVNGVDVALAGINSYANIVFGREAIDVPVIGVESSQESSKLTENVDYYDVVEGRKLRPEDKLKAVIGYKISRDAFIKEVHSGNTIMIEGIEFDVIGVMKPGGQTQSAIRINKDDAKDLFMRKNGTLQNEISSIFVLTKKEFKPSDVAEAIKKKLRKYRNVKEGEEDFTVQSAESVINTLNQILDIVQVVLVGIASISLIVGGIGIMNTMYTAVLERTKEIGIMKAVGARNSDIRNIFLIESGMLGIAGGLMGIFIGFLITKLAQFIASSMGVTLKAAFSPLLIFGALSFAFIVGSLSGVFPAMQAAELKPVDALRK